MSQVHFTTWIFSDLKNRIISGENYHLESLQHEPACLWIRQLRGDEDGTQRLMRARFDICLRRLAATHLVSILTFTFTSVSSTMQWDDK